MWKRKTAELAETVHIIFMPAVCTAMMRVCCKERLWPPEVPLRLVVSFFLSITNKSILARQKSQNLVNIIGLSTFFLKEMGVGKRDVNRLSPPDFQK